MYGGQDNLHLGSVTIEHRHAFGAIDRLEEEVAESNDNLHHAQAPAVLDHSRTLPQGGRCAAPKRCPGCGWGVPGLQETFLSVLDRRSQSTHAGLQGPYTGVALLVLRRAEGLLGLLIAEECLP